MSDGRVLSARMGDVRDDSRPRGHQFNNPLQKVMDQSPISGRPARNRSILRLVRFTIVPELMTLVVTRFTHLALARDGTVRYVQTVSSNLSCRTYSTYGTYIVRYMHCF